jgi:hypothetical protein
MHKTKIYIDTEGNDDQAYVEAMVKASEIATSDNTIQRVVLLVNTKKNTGWFERTLGIQQVRRLFTAAQYIDGLKPLFKLETKITYKDLHSNSDIVLTCGWDAQEVAHIDDYTSAKYIIAIPWSKGALSNWTKTWGATELRSGTIDVYPEPSCIVKIAMRKLTSSVNMSTALSHLSDVNLAKTYLTALYRNGQELIPEIISAYMITNLAWDTSQVKQITTLVESLKAGKQFKEADRNLDYYYNQWTEICNKAGEENLS